MTESNLPVSAALMNPPGEEVVLPPVNHVGLVVRDRDATIATYRAAMNLGPAFLAEPPVEARLKSGVATSRVRLGFLWLGNMLIEVIQPLDPNSVHAEFLHRSGEGLHHMSYMVDSISRTLDAMSPGEPLPLLADGRLPDAPFGWVYVDGGRFSGVSLELIERNTASIDFFEMIYKVTGAKAP